VYNRIILEGDGVVVIFLKKRNNPTEQIINKVVLIIRSPRDLVKGILNMLLANIDDDFSSVGILRKVTRNRIIITNNIKTVKPNNGSLLYNSDIFMS
jgi:hypothetical protein|tara:strand:+ start:384 stop:674 length:291 start_codon:yes stop_codon:yes gene_type:complete